MKTKIVTITSTTKTVTTITSTTRKRKLLATGFILYEGPSMFDGSPIVVIVTGCRQPSANPKTGAMLQTWIIRSDMHPFEAMQDNSDRSACGNCAHKGDGGKGRTCYVELNPLISVYRSYKAGRYDTTPLYHLLNLGMRIGSYGDPTAVPIAVWEQAIENVPYFTGYTQQWRSAANQGFKKFCMASCVTERDYTQAIAKGWKAFIVRAVGAPLPVEAIQCPQTANPDVTTCSSCKMCNGNTTNISVEVHGKGKKYL